MTMKKTYYTVNGELIGEKTTGGSRLDYLTDALGSVTATLNQSAQVVNTYRYKPYGSQLAKTGTAPDPAFTWVGTQGYRQTGNPYSDTYVRARVYSSTLGRWTTPDPIKSRGGDWNYYGYVHQRPTVRRDPSGLIDPWSCPACIGIVGGTLLGLLWACNGDPRGFAACAICALERNPALTLVLVGAAAVACGICIPQLAPIIIRIGTTVGTGGLGLAGAPALALSGRGGTTVTDPCNPQVPTCPWPRGGGGFGDEGGPINEPPPWKSTGPIRPGAPYTPIEVMPRPSHPNFPPVNPGRGPNQQCNPCPNNIVEIDFSPPSDPHFPCPGDHWHCRKYNQNPITCMCFSSREIGGCIPPPAPATC